LPRLLQPTLNRLAAQTRESFSAVVLDGDEVVIVARSASVGGQRLMAYGLHLGARLPVHATSTGRVLLAAMPRVEFSAWLKGRELPRLTPRTTVDHKALRALAADPRRPDFAQPLGSPGRSQHPPTAARTRRNHPFLRPARRAALDAGTHPRRHHRR